MDKNALTSTQDDQVLLKKLQSEGSAVLGVIYQRYRLEFIKFANRYRLDKSDILDAYQDAIIALYENVVNGKVETLKSSLKTYVFGIGKYKLIDKIKENQRSVRQEEYHLPDEISTEFLDRIDLSHRQQLIKEALQELGGACKKILHFFYYQMYSIESIRLTMNYKDDNVVKANKSRCMKSLRTILNRKDIL